MKIFFLFLICTVSTPLVVQAEDYVGEKRTYSSADVLALLGKKKKFSAPEPFKLGPEMSAKVNTSLQCGRLRFNYDMKSMIDKLKDFPEQLKKYVGNSGTAAMNAAPMLVLCYMSPTVCAELKNLNMRLDLDLKMMTDVCSAMDNYIGSQAEKGSKESKDRANNKCVNDQQERGVTLQQALDHCNRNPPPALNVDIAKGWIQDTVISGPQKVLDSLLLASSQKTVGAVGEENYKFLAAVLGETKIQANGKILPMFPAHVFVPSTLAGKMFQAAVDTTCNHQNLQAAIAGTFVPNSPDPEINFFQRRLFHVINDNIDKRDHNNLFDLDPPDQELMCNALGRAVGRVAILQTAADGESMAVIALQNPALPEDLRKMYESRVSQVFPAIREQAQTQPTKPIDELLKLLNKMSKLQREQRRLTAGTLSQGQMDLDTLYSQSIEDCDSDYTCK
jgi:hypothetical protein